MSAASRVLFPTLTTSQLSPAAASGEFWLTVSVDNIVGTATDEIFYARSSDMNAGDRLDGGLGTDTLQLEGGGNFDLAAGFASFTSIEAIRGSTSDDTITISSAQLSGVTTIDGGSGDDALWLQGATIDLRGKTIVNVEEINLSSATTQVTVDSLSIAERIYGYDSQNDHLVLTNVDLTDEQRKEFFLRGIDKITDKSGRTTINEAPVVTGLNGDKVQTVAGGTVILDKGLNLSIGGENDLDYMYFSFPENSDSVSRFSIRTEGTGVTLSDGVNIHSKISVDGVEIGEISNWTDLWNLDIEFYVTATPALVQKLIQAVTFHDTNTDASVITRHSIDFYIADKGGRSSSASIDVIVAPEGTKVLTSNVENVTGDATAEVFAAHLGSINAGDTLDGGGGTDTLMVEKGTSDLTRFAVLTGIEILQGSAWDDTIVANAQNLLGVVDLNGGAGNDDLRLTAGTYNFTGKTVTDFEAITLTDDATLTFDDRATALLVKSLPGNTASVTLTDDSFTADEIIRLFKQGIATVNDASGTHMNAVPEKIDLSRQSINEHSAVGTVVATLSANDPNASDTFTYTLLDSAGGRFKIEGNQLKVNNGALLDFEQGRSHTIKIQVTDAGGLSREESFTITVGDVLHEKANGTSGNDKLYSGKGNDTLNGGYGNDVLYGGAGKDKFVFDTALSKSANKDKILDWSAKDDTIQLENAIFKKLTKTGTLNKAYFVIGSSAKDANDFVGYNKSTGDLWYDSNGNGSGGQVVFANIGKNKAIAYNDFVVI